MNKYQKALDDLKWLGGDGYYRVLREKSYDILQELVDKETPKIMTNNFVCPSCNSIFVWEDKYCDNCGQHLDWGENEI